MNKPHDYTGVTPEGIDEQIAILKRLVDCIKTEKEKMLQEGGYNNIFIKKMVTNILRLFSIWIDQAIRRKAFVLEKMRIADESKK